MCEVCVCTCTYVCMQMHMCATCLCVEASASGQLSSLILGTGSLIGRGFADLVSQGDSPPWLHLSSVWVRVKCPAFVYLIGLSPGS